MSTPLRVHAWWSTACRQLGKAKLYTMPSLQHFVIHTLRRSINYCKLAWRSNSSCLVVLNQKACKDLHVGSQAILLYQRITAMRWLNTRADFVRTEHRTLTFMRYTCCSTRAVGKPSSTAFWTNSWYCMDTLQESSNTHTRFMSAPSHPRPRCCCRALPRPARCTSSCGASWSPQ